jgi:hypothetical protein
VSVWEQGLRDGRRGAQVRPFCQRADIQSRGYSLPLQKALVDFGSDESFLKATQKVREHYGVELPPSGARQQTLAHAKAIGVLRHEPDQAARTVATFMDGSMVPVVEAGSGKDKRKGKTLVWKQATLCCARSRDVVDCVYGATMGTVKMAGLVWRETAESAGLVEGSRVHGVADGAEAIVKAFEEQFGSERDGARFTLDFYHVSEYLAQAGEAMAPDKKKEWLHLQQGRLLENQVEAVLQTLEGGLEPEGQKPAPVRAAHHYMKERKDHMDYAGARAEGLPIGSGEVESGHGHVIQDRLKKAGAWWTLPNVQSMLQLRTTRANGDWDRYWKEFAKN